MTLSAVREAVAHVPGELAALADSRSRLRLLRLRCEQVLRGEQPDPVASAAVPVRVKALGGGELYIRPRSSDIDMIWCTYAANWHLPPPELRGAPERIVELGTN